MPYYAYICTTCGNKFDKEVPINDRNDSQVCPVCNNDAGERRLTPPHVWGPSKGA